jgi:hypothetical protein
MHRWLIIFDNAERPDDIARYQPNGPGHVLITSRFPGWGALGGRLEVDVLTRAETVALLRRRTPEIPEDTADALAVELGDLPLAAAQAAGYLEQTGLPPQNYLRRFRNRRASMLARGDVPGYRDTLNTTWALSLDRLETDDPAAVQLLRLATHLAPEPIPLRLFTDRPELLEHPLRAAAVDPDALDDAVGSTVRFALARRHGETIQLHRLVQAVIRQQLSEDEQSATAGRAVALLGAAHPGDPTDPTHWDAYAQLVPHVLAIGPLSDSNAATRQLAISTVDYLRIRGDNQKSRLVAEDLLARWRRHLGFDHTDTITLATNLTWALAWLGNYPVARSLGQDTLQRGSRVLGADHPITLQAAAALIFTFAWLADYEQARKLAEDNLRRCRRVLGSDHWSTLVTAGALALTLARLGEHEQARVLGEDSLDRARRLVGPDHPLALLAGATLIWDLSWLGEFRRAHDLGQDISGRCRRALGPDHPVSLMASSALLFSLNWLTHATEAFDLGQDIVRRCRDVLGAEHVITLLSAAVLASAMAGTDRHDDAKILIGKTTTQCLQALGADHLTTIFSRTVQADVLAQSDDVDRAQEISNHALERSRRVLGPNHLITLLATTVLASAHARLGDAEKAEELAHDTLRRCEALLGSQLPTTKFAQLLRLVQPEN